MHVVVLGAGTAIPARGYSPAGVYVRVAREHVVLDAGPGTLQRLHMIGVTLYDIRRVFFTHYHVDHCLDVVSMLFAMRIPHPARTKPLTLYGPPGLRRLIAQLDRAFHGWLRPRRYRLTVRELGQTSLRLPGYTVRTYRMRHSALALGYRLESAGRTIAYSGDTDVCDGVVALGRRTDLFLLECAMPDERKVTGHLTPTECGRLAAAAGARHLVLTHFYPSLRGYPIRRRVRQCFSGRLTLARDLQVVS